MTPIGGELAAGGSGQRPSETPKFVGEQRKLAGLKQRLSIPKEKIESTVRGWFKRGKQSAESSPTTNSSPTPTSLEQIAQIPVEQTTEVSYVKPSKSLYGEQEDNERQQKQENLQVENLKTPLETNEKAAITRVEEYYHQQIENLTEDQLRAIGTEEGRRDSGSGTTVREVTGSSVRELVCKASLIRAGVDLSALSIQEPLSSVELSALLYGKAEGSSFPGGDNTVTKLSSGLQRTAREKAIHEASEKSRAGDPNAWDEFRKLDSKPYPIGMTEEELQSRAAHIDELRKQVLPQNRSRLVVVRTTDQERQEIWTQEKREAVTTALGLTADEMEQIISYQIITPSRYQTMVAVSPIGKNGDVGHDGVNVLESASETFRDEHMLSAPAVLRPDNIGLQFTFEGNTVLSRTLPEGRRTIFNQYAMVGVIKAEELIRTGSTRP